MEQNLKTNYNPNPKTGVSSQTSSRSVTYRGFASIDQEMEREIAMQWFSKDDKTSIFLKIGTYKMR